MAKKITETQAKKEIKAAKKHPVTASRIVAILITAFVTVACFGTGCDWLLDPSTHEHIYSGWETTEEATCGEDGVKTRYCIVCGEEESEILPATGMHVYGGWTTTEEATCGEDGEKEHSCTVCGSKESEAIPATGEHTYGEWETTEPICGKDGEKVRTCNVCGDKETEVIPAIAEHSFSEWTTTEPTCGDDGVRTRTCGTCGEVESEVLPATGNHSFGEDNVCTVCHYNAKFLTPAEFSIHFLEIGKYTGDCVLIDCGETEVLIDAGSRKDSAPTIKKYLDKYVDGEIDYVISTHSDQDHIAALIGSPSGSSRTGIAYQYKIGTFIKFDKAGTDGNGKDLVTAGGNKTLYAEYVDMVSYIDGKGTKVYTASQCYEEKDGAKRQYYLDENNTLSLNILYNYYYYNASGDENNYSVVTLLTQELADGNKHYLFTGDLEESGESKMVDYYKNKSNSRSDFDILPKVELYKAGHHGSKTSSTLKLLEVIQPKNVAICCCAGAPEYTTNNDNTFPTQIMINNVGKYTKNIYVTTVATGLPEKDASGNYTKRSYGGATSMNGDIRFFIKGDEVELSCTNNNTVLKETAWFQENRKWNGV